MTKIIAKKYIEIYISEFFLFPFTLQNKNKYKDVIKYFM